MLEWQNVVLTVQSRAEQIECPSISWNLCALHVKGVGTKSFLFLRLHLQCTAVVVIKTEFPKLYLIRILCGGSQLAVHTNHCAYRERGSSRPLLELNIRDRWRQTSELPNREAAVSIVCMATHG